MTIDFKKFEYGATSMFNPMQGFQEETQNVEVRFDPLTGVRRLFNLDLVKKRHIGTSLLMNT